MMRWLFLLAALATLAVGAIHMLMGGIDTLNPIMASKASMQARSTIMVMWHAGTLFYVLSVLAFFWAFAVGSKRARPLGVFLGLFYLLFAAIFAAISFMWFEDPMALPQWTLLAPIGLLALLASF